MSRLRPSRRAVLLLTAALLGPALPSLAASPGLPVVTSVVHSAALALGATTAPLLDSDRLVGVTWAAGAPQVRVRWLTAAGWTGWEVPDDDSDVPEPAERAAARGGTEPLWRPPGASLVDVRVDGAAQDLQLVRVGDGVARRDLSFGIAPAGADERGLLPGVRSRADWGADESLRRGAPTYAAGVKAVIVHHTAGSNDYAPADVPRRIRADYAYHVQARGWSDLGYNVVVDKFGGIWEGRAGGLGRATIGSHAAGFNTGTLGVSLLGDMTKALPTPEAVRAVSQVTAYAADTWGFDPLGTVVLTSGGSPKYAAGKRVTLGRVHGHRDVGLTTCPGALYDRLGEVRRTASALLGAAPRLLSVGLTGAPVRAPAPLVVTGALSRQAGWFAELRDPTGAVVARTVGDSPTARLEWNGLRSLPGGAALPALLPALPGSYSWTVEVGDGVRPPDRRTGTFEVALPVAPA
ncbi:MAG: N-acetylmuramoyl-L-alanine amidase [Mycobacteriales bacterium]